MQRDWFHSYAFPDGETIDGIKSLGLLQTEADEVFRHGVEGRTVLDIGAWDGFFSYEAERRGARRVLATDHFCWSGPGWGTKEGFDYAGPKLGSTRVEALDIDLPDLSPETLGGRFDTVLFLGVLYHVKDPYGCCERAASVAADHLVLETVFALEDVDTPAMRYFRPRELNNDPTNFWAQNRLCLEAMFRDLGFGRFEFHPNGDPAPASGIGRYFMHAWRDQSAPVRD